MTNNIPKIKLTEPQKLWPETICSKLKKGVQVSARALKVELTDSLPRDFNPSEIDSLLLRDEDQITLLGIGLLDPDSELVKKANMVIFSIRELLSGNPEIKSINVEYVSRNTKLPEVEVAIIFKKLADIGLFHSSGTIYGYGVDGWWTITIDKRAFDGYLKYESLDQTLELTADGSSIITYQTTTQPKAQKTTHKDSWLKVLFAIIVVITIFMLVLSPTLGRWIFLLIEIGVISLIADVRGWVSEKIPQALDRTGSISSFLLAVVLAIYALQNSLEQNVVVEPSSTPTPMSTTSTPALISSPSPTQSVSASVIPSTEANLNEETIVAEKGSINWAFNREVNISVNEIYDLSNTVTATIGSNISPDLRIISEGVGFSTVYIAKRRYRIRITKVDYRRGKVEFLVTANTVVLSKPKAYQKAFGRLLRDLKADSKQQTAEGQS